MESKLAAVFAAQATGGVVPVTEICANLGICRQTYYKYRRRYQAEGLTGLEARSRRPLTSPMLTGPEATERIIRARKRLHEEGWDNGALSIWYWLLREGGQAPPAVRTIHRVLVRAGLVDPDPSKARRSRRRFQFPATDDCWQFDAFEYALADGTFVVVFELIDDHSRYLVASLVWLHEDTLGAWECLLIAVRRYHTIPFLVLTDNGLAFSGKRHGQRVLFERNAIDLGIKPITARPYHPQTNGKNERHHGTTKRWLRQQPLATTVTELQQQLDTYRDAYNHRRPHQALGGATPAEQRAAGIRRPPRPRSTGDTPTKTATITDCRANNRGYVIGLKNNTGALIPLGLEHAGKRLTVIDTGDRLLIFDRHHLLRDLVVDPTRRYQPLPTCAEPDRPPNQAPAPLPTARGGSPIAGENAGDDGAVNVQRPQRNEDERR